MNTRNRPILLFFSIVLVSLIIKLFAFDVLLVSGPSMRPALTHGNVVVENRLAWGIPIPYRNEYLIRWGTPRAGDVVIYPLGGHYVVKRCVAGPLEPLVFSDERGYSVAIADRVIPLSADQYQKLKNANRVPEGMIFALGDNMAESRDSRDYGFVSIDSIRGKALWK